MESRRGSIAATFRAAPTRAQSGERRADRHCRYQKGRDRWVHRGMHLVFCTDVETNRQCLAIQFFNLRGSAVDGAGQFRIGDVRLGGDDGVGAIACGAPCNRQADAARRDGKEERFTGKTGHCRVP